MTMINYLKERKSIRDFADKKLGKDEISNLQNAINEVNRAFGWNEVELNLVEDGEKVIKVLAGKAGYAGVLIEAPSYISVKYSDKEKINIIKGAFVMGEITTKILELKLGHCIVTLNDEIEAEKTELFGPEGKNVNYIIAVGYPQAKRAFTPEPTSSRKAVEEIAFVDEKFEKPATDKLRTLNMLDLFSALKLAPSYKNKQPWKFLIKDGEVVAFVQNDEELNYSLTDVGLIMYYFKEMANTMGINGNWDIVTELVAEGDYIKLGRFKI